jgi:hypothetical protein
MTEDLDAWSRLLRDDPLTPPVFTDERFSRCPVCNSIVEEVRCTNPNDCGGCETCDQYFGGRFMCSNTACEQRKHANTLIDAEIEAYFGGPTTPGPCLFDDFLDKG